jgi:hypothetical protein
MPERGNGWIAIGACALALCLVAAPARAQLSWKVRQLTGEAGKVTMFGMSCPSASMCVAVGGNNTLATSIDPTGDLSSWNVAYVGTGAVPTPPNGIFGGNQIRGVSCPSPSLCVAVTYEGLIYSSPNPTGGAGAWKTVDLSPSGPNVHLYGVSCPTASFCAASAGKGKVATTTDPTGEATDWTIAELGHQVELRGISCPSAGLCVAVGDDGDPLTYDGEVDVSANPLAGVWTPAETASGEGGLYGVSCPAATLCASGNLVGNVVVSTDPAGGSPAWRSFGGGGSVQITAASCVSASQCVLVDNNADVLTSKDPAGGAAAWTFDNLVPYSTEPGSFNANAMFGVSCPTAGLCAIAGAKGKIFTIDRPFSAGATSAAGGSAKHRKRHRKHRRAPKFPKVRLGLTPAPIDRTTHGRFKARYRFFANGRVRRFRCRMDRRRMRTCRSPKAFRVGPGRHVFRVRAIGLTGHAGPVTKHAFRVYTRRRWPVGTPPPGFPHR